MVSAAKKKILILGNSHLAVFKFRGELIAELVKRGYDVWTCFPNSPFGKGEKAAKEYGCHFIGNKIDRRGTNPFKDLIIIRDYYDIVKRIAPDVVLAYTVKPDVYGGIVCTVTKTPFIPNITGLGKGLDEEGTVQKLVIELYKMATQNARCVFFQNDSDRSFFDSNHIPYSKGITLPGSGVNLEKNVPLPYPKETDPVRFIYVARIMKTKGIEQFLEAAEKVKKLYSNVEFHICGYCEEDYEEILKEKASAGEIIYHGLVGDVRTYEEKCHCVVLPSFHPEGISNVLLEGAACARPLITTDHAGCRETVTDGVTGYIVRQRDSKDLADKMLRFIKLPYNKKVQMGIAGRRKVEREFDRKKVVDAYINEIKSVIGE